MHGLPADVFLPNGSVDRHLFTRAAVEALDEATVAARATRWESIRSPHLFMGLLAAPDRTVVAWSLHLHVHPRRLLGQYRALFRRPGGRRPLVLLHREFLSQSAIGALRAARERCDELDRQRITHADLLWAILARDGCVTACFAEGGVPAPMLRVVLAEAERNHNEPSGASNSF
jgi:ATP-dependent Clp protease ATP-binding subunit ClpA